MRIVDRTGEMLTGMRPQEMSMMDGVQVPTYPLKTNDPAKPPQLTESQKRLARRHDSSGLFEVPIYKVNEELYLEVVADDETLWNGLRSMCYLKLKIVNLLGTPWRSGCVMEVKCQEAPDPDYVGRTFVLKLIDSRFLGDMRSWRRFQNPTISTMKRFINMVCCGAVDEYLTNVDEKNYKNMRSMDAPNGALFSEWQQVALMHKHCQTVAEDEINAYNRRRELQGRCIPHLMYRVRTCPWHKLQAPFDRYFQYNGFVMEKVDGICLDYVGQIPKYFEREVYLEAINAVNSLEYYGFEHKSLAPRNLIVRHERQLNGTPCVMLIDLHKHLTWSSEDGYFKYKNVWAGSMERMMQSLSGYCDPFWFEEEEDDCTARNEEWEESIATGRFGEKAQFLNLKPGFENGTLADARSIADARALIEARNRWRVIMDDLWAVETGNDNLKGIDERASRSRIAHKIMRQEIGGMVFHWEFEDWHLRALPRIAEALDYEVEGITERFEKAFERYCERPNGQGLRLHGLADTCFLTLIPETIEEEVSPVAAMPIVSSERKDSALSDSAYGSQDVTPSYSPLCLQATAASSTTDMTSLSGPEIDPGEQAAEKPKEARRIFLPKHKPLPPIDVESYELGWM